jgi:thiamine pyrophosphate-dependent acetolactate synthase large subunit-like protein
MNAAENKIKRRDAIRELLCERGDLLVVAGLGSTAWDVAAVGDHANDFPLWGAMGGAAMLGLGLALAQPEHRVLVVTGDGEMLMGLGSLATIAAQQPRNLAIVVFDNECFGETGQQRTHTAMGADLEAIARGCGIADTRTVRELSHVSALRDAIHTTQKVLFAAIKIAPEELPRVLPPRDGAYLTQRMRAALLGAERAVQ